MKSFKLFFSLFTLLLVSSAFASVPQLINFQGRLTDSLGNPVSDGSYSLRFRIYDDSLAGNVLWEETDPVQITKGLFTVLLGSTVSIPESAFYSVNRWLGIKIGSNSEITPRQRLGSVGYAFQSGQWNSSGNNIYRDSGNVGIGTSSPTAKLDVGGTLLVNPSNSFVGVNRSTQLTGADYFGVHAPVGASAYGGMYLSTNTDGWPFYGYSNGSYTGWHYLDNLGKWHLNLGSGDLLTVTQSGYVGIGTSSPIYKLDVQTADYAIHGQGGANFTGILGEGYTGVAGLGGNKGVYGSSSAGTGVYGSSSSGNGVIAVSSTNAGIYAQSQANAGYFYSSNTTSLYAEGRGAGVHGVANNTSGNSYGGYFTGSTSSGEAYGVYAIGQNSGIRATGYWGVQGDAGANGGAGVAGTTGGYAAWAGYFVGDVNVTGTLYKGGLAFKIDHPLDPSNKYLNHSGVESPDMMNIYNGNVVTDANGNAIVTLPDWFGALNKDFRYQLTVIGQFAQAIVYKKIVNNQFSIKTDKPNVEVSWQVTGIRQDAWANAHRIPVEENKSANEKGKYLHPKELGLSETLGVDYERTKKTEQELKGTDKK